MKSVKISDEAYQRIHELGRFGESYSDVIMRFLPPKEEQK